VLVANDDESLHERVDENYEAQGIESPVVEFFLNPSNAIPKLRREIDQRGSM
jgi:hypothetical protein